MAMRHDVQDGYDAADRARTGYRTWHPILAATEAEPGTWYLVAPDHGCYGIVRFLELKGERGYRAVTWATESADRELIGYYRTLKAATEATHRRFLAGHASGTPPQPTHPTHPVG